MNKCTFIGRFTKDPELKRVGNDDLAILNFSLAVDRKFKKDGQPTADFLNFVAMGKPAEIIEKYCEKGSQLGIVSRVQTRNWEDKDGNKHYTTEFLVEDFTFIGGNKNSSGSKRETSSEDEDFVL